MAAPVHGEALYISRIGAVMRDHRSVDRSAVRLWPNRTVSRVVCLYIAVLGMNVLNCRVERVRRRRRARSPQWGWHHRAK
jgi:hypothetical protein